MKNLQNYGVQEMNAQEIREIEGGIGFWAVVGIICAINTAINEIEAGVDWYKKNARRYP